MDLTNDLLGKLPDKDEKLFEVYQNPRTGQIKINISEYFGPSPQPHDPKDSKGRTMAATYNEIIMAVIAAIEHWRPGYKFFGHPTQPKTQPSVID